ncbi:MFS transporter [candidate division KSB1 bacterium]|nr:MFS transporter [candidate division KSB1 bacterium]MBL7094807.1 MFS transporter [candidate division KSB1 bacterium]
MSNEKTDLIKESLVKTKWLFWGCFVALIATSFAFVTRFAVLADWGRQFNLSSTQMGEIGGAGVWPFAISIILFSLVIDKIGYGTAMIFAFICHVTYGIMVVFWAPFTDPKTAYSILYGGSVILALGNGTVEAVINPVVATMFDKEKTKWLNILHAGWPAGLVGAGLMTMAMGGADWRYKVGLIFLPAVIYGVMLLGQKWPVQERVAAGVSYKGMLQEFGVLASLLVVPIIMRQVAVVFNISLIVEVLLDIVLVLAFAFVVWPRKEEQSTGSPLARALGSPMLFVLMLIMIPLATTEIGTDGWITALMEKAMGEIGLPAVTVLVYTSAIMMILRFSAGPIVTRVKPLGLLAISAAIAAVGLFFLSLSTGITILIVATLYGLGKTFFWPTMLGVVSEQCPRGGALTLNAVGGMGMLAVGVLGMPFIGLLQDNTSSSLLEKTQPALYSQVVVEKDGILGQYEAIDQDKKTALLGEEKAVVDGIVDRAQHGALAYMAIFPMIMLVGYLLLILYFKSRGGYKPVVLETQTE